METVGYQSLPDQPHSNWRRRYFMGIALSAILYVMTTVGERLAWPGSILPNFHRTVENITAFPCFYAVGWYRMVSFLFPLFGRHWPYVLIAVDGAFAGFLATAVWNAMLKLPRKVPQSR